MDLIQTLADNPIRRYIERFWLDVCMYYRLTAPSISSILIASCPIFPARVVANSDRPCLLMLALVLKPADRLSLDRIWMLVPEGVYLLTAHSSLISGLLYVSCSLLIGSHVHFLSLSIGSTKALCGIKDTWQVCSLVLQGRWIWNVYFWSRACPYYILIISLSISHSSWCHCSTSFCHPTLAWGLLGPVKVDCRRYTNVR